MERKKLITMSLCPQWAELLSWATPSMLAFSRAAATRAQSMSTPKEGNTEGANENNTNGSATITPAWQTHINWLDSQKLSSDAPHVLPLPPPLSSP